MDYNFRGKYDATQNYSKKDIVSYQPTTSDPIKYYFCLTNIVNTSPQTPLSSGDSSYWGTMNTLSNFPNTVDSFTPRTNISASDKIDINRIRDLNLQTSLTTSEQTELTNLINKQRNKLILADDFNALQQSISNLQMFFQQNVQGYIDTMQSNVATTVNNGTTAIQTAKDDALSAIEAKKENIITYMDSTTAGSIRNDLGIITDLTTIDKTSLVNAVNEINAYLKDGIDADTLDGYHSSDLLEVKLKGSSTFNSDTGTIINHAFGHTNYYPVITPTVNPNGYLGEVWVEKADYSFKVVCSGSAMTNFDYVVFISNI